MLAAIVLAMPDPAAAADQGDKVFLHTLRAACPPALATGLLAACVVAQFLCGLATVTSASRMAFAFARDGGLPAVLRRVSPRFRSPSVAIWVTSVAAVLFTAYASLYTTIAAVCVIFLYVSYVLPTAAGLFAYGRSWTAFGPWTLGPGFRPLAVVSIVTCVGLIVIGMQPPNDRAGPVVLVTAAALVAGWFGYARKHFPGPPVTAVK
jgi:amino acid transporter